MNYPGNKKSFTLIEIMLVIALVALLATLAIPNILRSRIQTNETIAITSLKTISDAIMSFNTANQSLAGLTLNSLATANPPYLNSLLGCNSPPCARSGYNIFEITVGGANNTEYLVTTQPIVANITGVRSFCVTEDGIIRNQTTEGAIADHDACLLLSPVR